MHDSEDFPEAPPPIHKQPWFIGAAVGCGLLIVLMSIAFGVLVYELSKDVEMALSGDWEIQELTEHDREVLITVDDARAQFTGIGDESEEDYERWFWPDHEESIWLRYSFYAEEEPEFYLDSEACWASSDEHAVQIWHDETGNLREDWDWIEDEDYPFELHTIEIPGIPGQSHYSVVYQDGAEVGFSFVFRERRRLLTLDVYGRTFFDLDAAREFLLPHIATLRDHDF